MKPTRTPAVLLAASLLLAAPALLRADEGMWMPSQLPQLAKELKAAGFRGNPADLANLTRHPMSAVVSRHLRQSNVGVVGRQPRRRLAAPMAKTRSHWWHNVR